jgi:hypothetical protein
MCERTHCNMVTQNQPSSQRSRYAWTEAREQVFIDCLLDAVKQGERTDTGWKPMVASEAVDTFLSKGFPAVTKSQPGSMRDAVYDPRYRARSTLTGYIAESQLDVDHNRVWL